VQTFGNRLRAVTALKSALLLLFISGCCVNLGAASNRQSAAANTFLVVSDFHFNPMADPALVSQLDKAAPTEWEAILNRSKPAAFSQYGQDTNWWLLQSSLDQMHNTIPHPAFILIAGDSLAHRFPQQFQSATHDSDRDHYREFVLKTVKFLVLELRKRYSTEKIFVTPGNNDENCGNYSIRAGGAFLHDTAGIVRELAHGDDAMQASWEKMGSYDVPHPTLHGVRLISLNTIYFSPKYHAANFGEDCAIQASNEPADEFAWLETRLSAAQKANQKVWLMFHIPPGIDPFSTVQQYLTLSKGKPASEQLCASAVVPMWVPEWTAKFDALLEKYHDTVIVSLAGHTHTDDFRVINSESTNPSFILINPAISPVYNQNPGFRTVTFARDGSLTDASVYYLTNLAFASSTTAGEWDHEYTFSQEWKLPKIDAAGLASLYNKIRMDESARGDWLKFYNVSSSAAYLPADTVPGLYCAIEELDPESYTRCYCPAPASDSSPNAKP
jgi:sphingomyelin phosphodiesterase acid-like 3